MVSKRAHVVRVSFVLTLLFAGGAMGFAAGCGNAVSSFCAKVCDCRGCSDSKLQECIDEEEAERKESDDAGCGSEFDDFLACAEEKLTCAKGDIVHGDCDSTALHQCENKG